MANLTDFQKRVLQAVQNNRYPGTHCIAREASPLWLNFRSRGALVVQVRRALFQLEKLGYITTFVDENNYLISCKR